jgi:hypothetical protein
MSTLRRVGLLSRHAVRRRRGLRALRIWCRYVSVEYVGFTIEDRFVVGYGHDYAEAYRALPYIGVVQT